MGIATIGVAGFDSPDTCFFAEGGGVRLWRTLSDLFLSAV
jgi:hypothetical protein